MAIKCYYSLHNTSNAVQTLLLNCPETLKLIPVSIYFFFSFPYLRQPEGNYYGKQTKEKPKSKLTDPQNLLTFREKMRSFTMRCYLIIRNFYTMLQEYGKVTDNLNLALERLLFVDV